jgi:hypothetical protein
MGGNNDMVNSKKASLSLIGIGLAAVLLCFGVIFATDAILKEATGKNTEYQVFSSTNGHNLPFGEITVTHGAMLLLEIPYEMNLSSIDINLATYARVNSCEVDFTLLNNGIEAYRFVLRDARVLKDNSYFRLNGIDMKCQPDDTVELLVTTPDGEPGNAITFWMQKDDDSSQAETALVYNPTTGETTAVAATPDYRLNENRSYHEWLSRNYENHQSNVSVFCGLVAFFFILIIFELLPLDAFKNRRKKADETKSSIQ